MRTTRFARCATSVVAIMISLAVPESRASAQGTAVEEPWFFTAEGMIAGALNTPPRDQFGVGGGGSFGVYRSFFPELSLGLALGAGALSAGGPVAQDPVDRGVFDWGSLSARARVRPFGSTAMDADRRASGLWLEVGAGPWLIEGHVDPVFDAAIGFGADAGPIVVAPFLRFTHILETQGRYGDDAFLMGSLGLEVAWNDRIVRPTPEPDLMIEAPAPAPVAAAAPPALTPEEDVAMPFVNDQLIIDERVFFDYDGWDLRPTGMAQLDEVVRRYEESGGRWEALVISGHADRRGPEEYNVDLSRKRAEAVSDYLTAHGVPANVLELAAYGESTPAIPDATSEWEHQVNRRVQFEIVWRPGERPEGVAPVPRPTYPDSIDLAPEDRRDAP